MIRGMMVAAFVALCGLTFANQDQRRLDEIWKAINNRLETQKNVWFNGGDYPACIELLRFEVEQDPLNYEHQTDLGWMLENCDRYDQALAVYIKYRKEHPEVPDAAFPEADFYFKHKAYAKVPPLIEPTLKLKPHSNSFRVLAHSYEKLGLLADAKRVWQLQVRNHPDDSAAKVNLQKIEGKMMRDPAPVSRTT